MSHRGELLLGALLALCVWTPAAEAQIPSSLKASCTGLTPHPGYSYEFCDDGLPPSGGTTPNELGTAAVEVPAKYQATGGDDWTGLPARAADATSMAGSDTQGNIALDVDISMPTTAPPPGGYPLLVMMHGCCAGSKTGWEATSFDAGGELWHYNNAWFAARGYVVVNYTARGFHNGESSGSRGSTGETQLDSRRFEINDFQHLAGLVADDPFFLVNPQRVVATGGSYGGGFSWLTLTDPIWSSPDGIAMKLAAVAPKYGWTDLVYSLVPTGRHFQTRDRLPDFTGLDSTAPIGIPKRSIISGLYASGKTGIPPGSAHTTFPPYIDEAITCMQSSDPFESNPLCANTISTTLPSFINDRSAYYQQQFFDNIASNAAYRIPIFNAATFTDPLFTPVENLRMSNRLQATVPSYPIKQYFGDYQHFVQNKAKEWGDICGNDRHVCTFADYPGGNLNVNPGNLKRTGVTTRLNRLVDHYAQPASNPSEPAPAFDVTASLQICPQNAGSQPADEPGLTFTAPRFEDLAPNVLRLDLTGTQTTTNDASPNSHAANSDPVANQVANGSRCPVENSAAGAGVATYESAALPSSVTMIGATAASIDYSTTSTTGNFQLDSRLYDVFPSGQAVMVDRGVRRVTQPNGTVTYQLHGNGWRFEVGHKIRIEIAQDDDPYLKLSSVPSSATLTGVKLEIPVVENVAGNYARPGSATPIRAALVPSYARCTAPNSVHVAPLSLPACSSPAQESGLVTTSAAGKGFAFARLRAIAGNLSTSADEADIAISSTITDVRDAAGGSDYTGQLILRTGLRITDRASGFFGTEPATAQDFQYGVPVGCSSTPSTGVGSVCSVSTSFDTLLPGSAPENKRSVISAFSLNVEDAGPDETIDAGNCPLSCGSGDESEYLRQGVFLP
jgi:X-Pro dipeptidyl-peptidase C-terminal non-catalytic domain